MRPRSTARLDDRFAVLTFLALLAGAGCVAPLAPMAPGATRTDRLLQVYPELRSGRFVIIADFEDPKHLDLFRADSASESVKITLDPKGGRAETGKACLTLTVASPDDTMVVGNAEEARWYLKRDWRAYDLLMMAVFAPTEGLSLDLTISSGAADRRMSARTTLRLDKEWNVPRLDLAEIAELVALDDVQEMRWSIGGATKATTVRFDDIVLTSNREDVCGDSRNGVGALYVQRAGRRWNVGTGGGFEITFAHGQIVSWFNLASDPNRVRNLVQGTTLGPSPVVVTADGAEAGDFAPLGRSVAARQELLEANRVRAVVTCEWHFVDDPERPTTGRPFQRWVYTIYPTGQVYVAIEATARTEAWTPPGLGLAASLASSSSDDWKVEIETGASARSESADAWLLYAVGGSTNPIRMTEVREPSKKRLSLTALVVSDRTVAHWSANLHLGRGLAAGQAEAERRLAEYLSPSAVRVEVGSPVSAGATGAREATPDAADGAYKIAADQGRVRWTLDGRMRAMHSPVFEVSGVGEGSCWVYVDHLILDNAARTREGNLVFQIPGIVERVLPVEVLCGR